MSKKRNFLRKAKLTWGYKYDYSEVNYINYRTPVCIIYGDEMYYQTPGKHLSGKSPEKTPIKMSNNQFIEQSQLIWKDRFIYDRCVFDGMNKTVSIFDTHLDRYVNQMAKSHLKGHIVNRVDAENFINRSNMIYQYQYNYILDDYTNLNSQIQLVCSKHGKIEIKASSHLNSFTHCKDCSEFDSVSDIVKFLDRYNLTYSRNHVFNSTDITFDFYIPSIGKVIDFRTRQNYQPIELYGGKETYKNLCELNNKRTELCEEIFIDIIVVRYDVNDVYKFLWDNIGHFI